MTAWNWPVHNSYRLVLPFLSCDSVNVLHEGLDEAPMFTRQESCIDSGEQMSQHRIAVHKFYSRSINEATLYRNGGVVTTEQGADVKKKVNQNKADARVYPTLLFW